jgi:LmbE family N-acetylglucosaminyl deacetylase
MALGWKNVRSLLCLGAHPDDIEIGCGGTIATLSTAFPGLRVSWVVLSGARQRADEARRRAHAFCQPPELEYIAADFRDSFFPYEGAELMQLFHELAGRLRPDLIFTHHRHDRHQDHRVVAELTWNAFRGRTILEYEIPKWEGDLGQPNLYVPLSAEVAERKIAALLEYFPSQRDKPWFDRETFAGLLRLRGLESQSPTRYAEAFHAPKLVIQ